MITRKAPASVLERAGLTQCLQEHSCWRWQ